MKTHMTIQPTNWMLRDEQLATSYNFDKKEYQVDLAESARRNEFSAESARLFVAEGVETLFSPPKDITFGEALASVFLAPPVLGLAGIHYLIDKGQAAYYSHLLKD